MEYHKPEPVDSGIAGYRVEATDGPVGTVDGATEVAGAGHVVVDTSSWRTLGLGRRVLIRADAIDQVDDEGATVRLRLTRDEVKDAPEYDGPEAERDERPAEQPGDQPFERWMR
jgi:hypothetical protein